MREIGVRELKRALSKTLHDVGRGERVRVTIRGRPLADIVPAGDAGGISPLSKLVAEGRITAPVRNRPRRSPPLLATDRPASLIIIAERNAER